MSRPLVSIIIPFLSLDKSLMESIDSITKQTLRDFEIILVKYASNKHSNFLISYKNTKVHLISHTSLNINTARNWGLKKTKGKYIVIMDSCDIWDEQKLEIQVQILEKKCGIGLVYCGGEFKGYVFEKLVLHNFLNNSSTAMFRKDCINKEILFSESLDIASCWEFFLRFSLFHKFTGIKDLLMNPGPPVKKGVGNWETFKSSGFKTLNKVFELENITSRQLKLINLAYAMRYVQIGKKYMQKNCYDRARGFFAEAAKRDFSICFKSDIILFYVLSCYRHCVCKPYA